MERQTYDKHFAQQHFPNTPVLGVVPLPDLVSSDTSSLSHARVEYPMHKQSLEE